MNLTDRNAELDKARALKGQIAEAESRLDATDGEEGTLKDELQAAHQECEALIKIGERNPRVGVLFTLIHELQEKLRAIAHEPSIRFRTHCASLGSDFGGYQTRDWMWLKDWRIGQREGHGRTLSMLRTRFSARRGYARSTRTHAGVFLSDPRGCHLHHREQGQAGRDGGREIVAGRARNAEVGRIRRTPARRCGCGEGTARGRDS